MSVTLHPRTRRFLIGAVGIWLLLGVEIGVFYSHAARPVLVPVALVAGLLEWLIITVLFLQLDEEPWIFSVALYPLLLLAVLLVGTLTLLLRVFFE
jgi:hypothetical protein